MVDVKDNTSLKEAVRKAYSWLVFGLLLDPKMVEICSSETCLLRTHHKTAVFNTSVSSLLLEGLSYEYANKSTIPRGMI
jgi:hypothetical protein